MGNLELPEGNLELPELPPTLKEDNALEEVVQEVKERSEGRGVVVKLSKEQLKRLLSEQRWVDKMLSRLLMKTIDESGITVVVVKNQDVEDIADTKIEKGVFKGMQPPVVLFSKSHWNNDGGDYYSVTVMDANQKILHIKNKFLASLLYNYSTGKIIIDDRPQISNNHGVIKTGAFKGMHPPIKMLGSHIWSGTCYVLCIDQNNYASMLKGSFAGELYYTFTPGDTIISD